MDDDYDSDDADDNCTVLTMMMLMNINMWVGGRVK